MAVLVSGSGTNLQSLIDTRARGAGGPIEIVLVVSSRAGRPAAWSAPRRPAIPTEVVALKRAASARSATASWPSVVAGASPAWWCWRAG